MTPSKDLGAELTARHRGVAYTALVEPDGCLRIGKVRFKPPSSAGAALTHGAINGWQFWYRGEQPLSVLRESLAARSDATAS